MKCIVTEKPSVAMQFADALDVHDRHDGYMEGNGWVITWCLGHLVTLSYPQAYDPALAKWSLSALPFLPETYRYEVIPSSAKQYRAVKAVLTRPDVDVIYNAGDSGREGEYIQRLVYTAAGVEGRKKILRVWIDSQTRAEILRGICEAKPESVYDRLSAAAYERAIADYAVGINLSRAMSCALGPAFNKALAEKKYTPIAVGRVMSCVLGMVSRREAEISAFSPTGFYKIDANVAGAKAHWKAVPGSRYAGGPLLYDDGGFLARADADAFAAALSADPRLTAAAVTRKTERKPAPLLFNLAELQAECAKRYHISPAETLAAAQSLYEKRMTTYPRTDARVLSTAVAAEVDRNLRGISGAYPEAETILQNGWTSGIADTKYTDDEKITDHYAIIPTGEPGEAAGTEKDIYDLICRRFLAIFFPPAEYDAVSAEFTHATGEHFFASGKTLREPGYTAVYGERTPETAPAFSVTEGETYPADFGVAAGKTQPPKRYTTGSMILAMENAGRLIEDENLRAQIKGSGIGTSATRAEILTKLEKLKYIAVDKKTQTITPARAGTLVNGYLADTIPDVLSPEMTARWETGLAEIESGRKDAADYRREIETFVREKVAEIKAKAPEAPARKDAGKCPVCGRPVYESPRGYYCSGWRRDGTGCGFAFPKTICGHTLTTEEAADLMAGRPVPTIPGLVGKSGKTFAAGLAVGAGGKVELRFPEGMPTDKICPRCGKRMTRRGLVLSCACGFRVPAEMAHREFSQEEINTLERAGRLDGLDGFVSRKGKAFSASVALRNGKLEFDF